MNRWRRKVFLVCIVAVVALTTLAGVSLAAPGGCLIVPADRKGVMGGNPVLVTATGLQVDALYRIKMGVTYHKNPRTPPEDGAQPPPGYTVNIVFTANDATMTHAFTVLLPDCHWQPTAGFTLYYSYDGGASWHWVGLAGCDPDQAIDLWSDCLEGCTPGYWKNHLSAWGPTGYSPSDDFDTTFGVDYFDPDITLGQAVNLKGNKPKVKQLARHGTAALLSASHPDIDWYGLSAAQVIAYVQGGIGNKNTLEYYNEMDCPLD